LYSDNQNQTTLTHDFFVKETEVTQGEWTAEGLANRSGAYDSGERDCIAPGCPASNMTWDEALAFANKLSLKAGLDACYALTGCSGELGEGMICTDAGATGASLYECNGYRIPTEAEWEYAARAGTTTAFFSGDITPQASRTECRAEPALEPIAWYCANNDASTMPGGLKQPNAWGLRDTSGNVFEWVSDAFDGLGYGTRPRVDPGGQIEPALTSPVRGGVAWGWATMEKSASRRQIGRHQTGPGIGLRLVRRAD
jgi:formylglycine-generating enzyme required for sulfatase activity